MREKVKVNKGKNNLKKLLKRCSEHNSMRLLRSACLANGIFHSGCSMNEILSIKLKDVLKVEKNLVWMKIKSNKKKSRSVCMEKSLFNTIKNIYEYKGAKKVYLFSSETTAGSGDRAVHPNNALRSLKLAYAKCNLHYNTPRVIREMAIRSSVKRNSAMGNLKHLASYYGVRSAVIRKIYIQMYGDNLVSRAW